MKKIFGTFAVITAVALMSMPAFAEGVFGVIYKNATEPGVGFAPSAPYKKGCATCKSFFGIVGLGDCSVNQAAKNGSIKNVTYYDTHTLNILGFKKVTTQVYGN
ncbi:MAG: TRL domain-containing protein [bacterium]|nr:TRL domain-containing protein [bacterium]